MRASCNGVACFMAVAVVFVPHRFSGSKPFHSVPASGALRVQQYRGKGYGVESMNTKQLDRMATAILCSRPIEQQRRTPVKAVAWSEGETLEQAKQRQREKSERIRARIAAKRGA